MAQWNLIRRRPLCSGSDYNGENGNICPGIFFPVSARQQKVFPGDAALYRLNKLRRAQPPAALQARNRAPWLNASSACWCPCKRAAFILPCDICAQPMR